MPCRLNHLHLSRVVKGCQHEQDNLAAMHHGFDAICRQPLQAATHQLTPQVHIICLADIRSEGGKLSKAGLSWDKLGNLQN